MSAAHFRRLGMPDADAASRAALVHRVVEGFSRRVGADPCWRWFVPGRIEVFGKHTDYAGGRSLLAAVPRGFGVAAAPRGDGRVRVIDVRYGTEVEIDPQDRTGALTGWASYVQVVARRLASNFPGADLGLDLAIASDLPRAAGLSSSSALVVGVGQALATRAGLAQRDDWRAQIGSVQDLAWYLGCVENGLDYRGLAGTAGVGTHGGSEDHTAILACRAEHLSQYRFVPVTHQGDVRMPGAWRFVIASSGVHADKAGSRRDDYNRASLATRALLACWNQIAPEPAVSLAAALADEASVARLLAAVRSGGAPAAYTPDALAARLAHFVAEDARVPAAAQAFASADAEAVGGLSRESQRQADEWLGNQVPETRALAAAAFDTGAWAASSFGAGFGGSVWALVAAADADQFAEVWLAEYRRRCPHAAGVEWFSARPGPALTAVPV